MLAKFDFWIGKTLFVPPIVRICQWLGWSQRRFARTANMLFYLVLVGSGWADWNLFARTVLIAGAICAAVNASWMPDRSMRPINSVDVACRRAVLIFASIDTALLIVGSELSSPRWVVAWLLLLAAEYARTVDTIPPLDNCVPRRAPARRSA